MKVKFLSTLFIYLFLLCLIHGCSSVSTTPVQSGCENSNNTPDMLDNYDRHFQSGILGVFSGHINKKDLVGELSPIRNVSSQDVLEIVDITNFLSLAPCTDCVKLRSIELDADGNVVANIGVRHPFEAGDPLKPPTGKNRLDLHVFNIEGIVVLSSTLNNSYSGFGKTISSSGLLNASGYTDYLANSLNTIFPTASNLHPYILHFRDYTEGNFDPGNPNGFADPLNPSGYLVMPMGGGEDIRPYVFDFTNINAVDFILAIGCTYGISAETKSVRLNPVYRLPQFNKKAASEVIVEVFENNLLPNNASSSAILHVSVLDMNHGVAVGEGLGEMRAESNVASISVEVEGVTSPVTVSNPTLLSGSPKNPDDPMKFEISFTNSLLAPMGFYRGLVKVVDSYPVGLNASPLLSASDGISRVDPLSNPLTGSFNITEFATYQAFMIEVVGNQPPVCDLDASDEEIDGCSSITLFPGAGTYDPDANNIVLYEYDFDYDGIVFDTDASNTTGAPVTAWFNNTSSGPIVYTVAMRLTDDGDPVMSSICTLDITVNPFWLDINFLSPGAEVTSTPFANHGNRHDPALALEDDGEYAMAYTYTGYASPGNDTALGLHSSNGINWYWTQGMIGSNGIGPPLKLAADKGGDDSYAYFSRSADPDYYSFIAKTQPPYEYSWFNVHFDHCPEIHGSKATGYIFAFGDDNDRIERRRGTVPHLVQNAWTLLPIPVSDPDPRLSWVRSVGEDVSGNMFLAYFNSTETAIRQIKSNEPMGDTWTEGTIWDGTGSGYSQIKNPGVCIDGNNNINVSFTRRNDSTGANECCYLKSIDGGITFSSPVVVASSSVELVTPQIVYANKFAHDVIVIMYEKENDIMLAISCDYGVNWIADKIIANTAMEELNPDIITDHNKDLVMVWEVVDPVYSGSIYACKASIIAMP